MKKRNGSIKTFWTVFLLSSGLFIAVCGYLFSEVVNLWKEVSAEKTSIEYIREKVTEIYEDVKEIRNELK